VGGGSKKLWSIGHLGASLTFRLGGIGTEGQEETTYFTTAREARQAENKLISAKLREGYVEVKQEEPDVDEDDVDEELDDRRKRLPRSLGKRLDWDALALKFGYRLKSPIDAKWRRDIEKTLGLGSLPPSYCEFLIRLSDPAEWELACQRDKVSYFLGIFLLPFYTAKRWREERARLQQTIGRHADEQPELVSKYRALVPFATDASGTHICWHPEHTDARGEPPIYVVDDTLGDLRVDLVAADLLELLQYYKPRD